MSNEEAPGPEHTPLSDNEHFALELRWYDGRMLPYVEWLLAFAAKHRHEIKSGAGGSQEPAVLLAALKRLIVQRGSMHMAGELKDQMREIENELWYRGEKGEHDRSRIKLDWTATHATAWRRWRIKEYLFAADRCASRLMAVLTEQG